MATISERQERNPDATAYVGDLDARVTETLLWELFLQAAPIVNVYIPRDKVTSAHSGYGFVEFRSEEDCEYAIKVMSMIKLFDKPIRVNRAARDKRSLDIGANVFIGNLSPEVDEKALYDAFSMFGVITSTPKIMRDPDSGVSKGFGFVNFDSFTASDAAIEAMNGQYLGGRPIRVMYSNKREAGTERHGTTAERMLASLSQQMRSQQAPQQSPHMGYAPPGAGGFRAPPPPMGMGMGMGMGMMGPPGVPPYGMGGMPGGPYMRR